MIHAASFCNGQYIYHLSVLSCNLNMFWKQYMLNSDYRRLPPPHPPPPLTRSVSKYRLFPIWFKHILLVTTARWQWQNCHVSFFPLTAHAVGFHVHYLSITFHQSDIYGCSVILDVMKWPLWSCHWGVLWRVAIIRVEPGFLLVQELKKWSKNNTVRRCIKCRFWKQAYLLILESRDHAVCCHDVLNQRPIHTSVNWNKNNVCKYVRDNFLQTFSLSLSLSLSLSFSILSISIYLFI